MAGDNVTLIQGEAELKTEILKVSFKLHQDLNQEKTNLGELQKVVQTTELLLRDDIRKGFLRKIEEAFIEQTFPVILSVIAGASLELEYIVEKKKMLETYDLSNEEQLDALKNLAAESENIVVDAYSITQVVIGAFYGKIGTSASRDGQLVKLLTQQKQIVESKSFEQTSQQAQRQSQDQQESVYDRLSR